MEWIVGLLMLCGAIWIIKDYKNLTSRKPIRNNKKPISDVINDDIYHNVSDDDMVRAIRKIISDFGAFMQSKKFPVPGCIADTKRLPYSKDIIKAAMQYYLIFTTNNIQREGIAMTYTSLADFQDDVGEEILGLNFSKIRKETAIEMTKSIVDMAGNSNYKSFRKLADIESGELNKELNLIINLNDIKDEEKINKIRMIYQISIAKIITGAYQRIMETPDYSRPTQQA